MVRPIIFILLVSLTLLSGCFYCGGAVFSSDREIGFVEVKGLIIEPDAVVEDLEKARKDKDIKAVIVRVDSPGGSVGASEEIWRTIKALDEKKPVVVSMGDVAASGGYLAALGGRKIFANESTVTGSIGVRMELLNARDLYEFVKLKPETIKSGKFKDMGSTTRPLTEEERAFLNSFIAELHEQFKARVSEARKIDIEKVSEFADGRVFTGVKAKEMGLIDEIGGYIDAKREAANLAGIKGEPKVVKMRKDKSWWMSFLPEEYLSLLDNLSGRVLGHKYFLYEWRP